MAHRLPPGIAALALAGAMTGALTAASAAAQVALEGEHAVYDVPTEDWSAEEELVDGAFYALLYGELPAPGDRYAAGEAEFRTVDAPSPEAAMRAAEGWNDADIEALPSGGAVAHSNPYGDDHAVWTALPTEAGVLLGHAKLSGVTEAEARATALRLARGITLRDGVTSGFGLAGIGPETEAERQARMDAMPTLTPEEQADLEALYADAQAADARAAASAAAPAAAPASPAAAPLGGAAYPVAVFGGSYNLYPKDGFLTLYLMSDGTAQRVTRPAKGGRAFSRVAMAGNTLTLSGDETITYALSQDADGTGRGTRQGVRGYEHLWAIPQVRPEQAARWVGSFAQRRQGGGSGGGYVRPGQPRNTVTTSATSEIAFDRGRYTASESFVTSGTFRGSRAGDRTLEDATGMRAGPDAVFGRGGTKGSGTYTVDGYRLLLTPDDGSGPYERTIVVQPDGQGGQTLYLDGQVWLGDFDVF